MRLSSGCNNQQKYALVLSRICRRPRLCAAPKRCFTTASRFHKQGNNDASEDGTINFFEQDVVPREDGKGFRPIGPPQKLQERIRQLEHELRELKTHVPHDLDESEEASFPHDGLHGLIDNEAESKGHSRKSPEEARQDRHNIEEDLNATMTSKEDPEIALRLPDSQLKSLKRLNQVLRQAAAGNGGPETARSLWRCYKDSKQAVPGLLQHLPESAWRILWETQYENTFLSDARSKHLWILVDDMVQAGCSLTPTQKMVQIEARFAVAQYHDALQLWNAVRADLSGHPDLSDAFWAMGTRLRLAIGEVGHALSLAVEAAHRHPRAGVSSLVPVLETYLGSGTDVDIQQAAAAYFRFRIALGSRMTLEDFDRLAICFLNSRQPDLAIGVFKDMFLYQNSQGSADVVARKSNRLFHEFQTQTGADAEHANQVSLKMLQFLPRQLQNKYFYASWLKRLIGLNELEAAIRVLELMYHRGVRPDAKHLNGLMSAWLRRGTPHARDMALELGKSMISARLKFVAARSARRNDNLIPPGPADPSASLPPYLGRALPPATIETFSILLLYYESSNMPASMSHLQETLHLAELAPNIFFVNHLLHGHLRAGDIPSAWKLYCTAVQNRVRPDLDTFAILWEICKSHVELHAPGKSQKFPTPRALFGHMSNWFGALRTKDAAAAREAMTPEFYVQIIRCLYLARDMRGTLVALYALRDMLKAYPDQKVVRLVAMLVARVGEPITTQRIWRDDGTRTRRRRSVKIRAQESQSNFEQVLRVLEKLKDERQAELKLQGLTLEAFSNQQKGEELLWLLAKLLKDCLDLQSEQHAESRGDDGASGTQETCGIVQRSNLSTFDARLDAVAFEMGAGGVTVYQPVHELWENPDCR
jgi:hypothetical protein